MAFKSKEEYNAYMREYVLARYHRRRLEWVEEKGGRCVQCGDEEDLEFDHVDPATKLHTISALWSLSDDKVASELEKCQLLCNSCHKEKSTAEAKGRRTHGKSYLAITKHCPCHECVAVKREIYRQRYAKRKLSRDGGA